MRLHNKIASLGSNTIAEEVVGGTYRVGIVLLFLVFNCAGIDRISLRQERLATRAQAEALAYDWWKTYRHDGGTNAGWCGRWEDGRYFVGRQVTLNWEEDGNKITDHRTGWHGAANGGYAQAFVKAISNGYPPLDKNGNPDLPKAKKFLLSLGKLPAWWDEYEAKNSK